MDKDYFSDVYKDFFGEYDKRVEESKNNSEKIDNDFSINIDSLLVSDESKTLLENISNYMVSYKDKNKSFIPFNIIIQSNNDEVIDLVLKNIEKMIYDTNYLSKKKCVVSFYELDSLETFRKNISDNSLIVFKGIKGLSLKDNTFITSFFYEVEEAIKNNKMFIIPGSKEDLDVFFSYSGDLKLKYFPFIIEGVNPTVQDVYQEILNNINEEDYDDEFKIQLLDYISDTFSKTDLDYPTYRNKLTRELLFNHKVPSLESEKTIDEIFEELNELVGLEKVKKALHELVDYMTFQKKSKDFNLKAINLHMVFLGNPGTGKTTVARLISGILYQLGFIKQNKLIEVSTKDLVAEYVGQTAPKVMSVVDKAKGGVLFIDEAYALASDGQMNSYNDEAIATLIKAMEDYRDELVVIFAGYTKEMQKFLDSNSGIVSRIGYTLEFDDYSEDELVEIFEGMTRKAGFVVEDKAVLKLRSIINEYKDMKNFGNARFIRNVYEKTIIKHASNTRDKKRKSILKTITEKDISVENIKK